MASKVRQRRTRAKRKARRNTNQSVSYRQNSYRAGRRLDDSLTVAAILDRNRQRRDQRRNNESAVTRNRTALAGAALLPEQSRSPERPKNIKQRRSRLKLPDPNNCVPKPNSAVAGRISAGRQAANMPRAKTKSERLRSFRVWCR